MRTRGSSRSLLAPMAGLADATHVVLRVGAGVLFFQHGLQKLFGLLGGKVVPLASLMGVAGVLELVGGVLLIAGLFTRPVALVLVAEMAAAYVIAHLPRGGWPVQNMGELPLLYALVFAYFVGNGAGRWSLDAWWQRRASNAASADLRARRAA